MNDLLRETGRFGDQQLTADFSPVSANVQTWVSGIFFCFTFWTFVAVRDDGVELVQVMSSEHAPLTQRRREAIMLKLEDSDWTETHGALIGNQGGSWWHFGSERKVGRLSAVNDGSREEIHP